MNFDWFVYSFATLVEKPKKKFAFYQIACTFELWLNFYVYHKPPKRKKKPKPTPLNNKILPNPVFYYLFIQYYL